MCSDSCNPFQSRRGFSDRLDTAVERLVAEKMKFQSRRGFSDRLDSSRRSA